MQVTNLTAEPNFRGGRIDLSWINPPESAFGGVKILRRESAFPEKSDLGTGREIDNIPVAVIGAGKVATFSDANLKSETVYYYTLVVYDLALNISSLSHASAMTTTPYQSATHIYKNLPAIYRRYDTNLPPDVSTLEVPDRDKGQLLRFVEMFGSQFDLLRSFASGMNIFADREKVDGALLPLLASWIGWETNYALDFDKQRGEIQYASHFYRTTGIAASLRATVNRLVTWNTQIKEFVHSVLMATGPEQLLVWEKVNKEDVWQDSSVVSLDVAYEGRPATLVTADKRQWLFHHARQSPPLSSDRTLRKLTHDNWHIWYKLFDQDGWLAARRISFTGEINKYPTAIEDDEGRVWVFWAHYKTILDQSTPEIRLSVLAAGQPARPARALGTNKGPFVFSDGMKFLIKVTNASRSFTREITLRPDYFQNIAAATAEETAALLNREIPGVTVTATKDAQVLFKSTDLGQSSQFDFPASAAGALIGVTGTVNGTDAVAAELQSRSSATFALADGDALSIRIDGRIGRVVTFSMSDFSNIAAATPAEIAAAINRTLPGVAQVAGNRVKLKSTSAGEASSVVVDVFPSLLLSLATTHVASLNTPAISTDLRNEFSAAGFELSALATVAVQLAGNQWLITDSARSYLILRVGKGLNVYNPALAAPKLGFGTPLPAPPTGTYESEPALTKDFAGRPWLFWSSRRNGGWKIWFSRFDGTAWGNPKVLTTGTDSDREPAVLFSPAGGGRLWVFWSRKKPNGLWNIFSRTTTNLNFNTVADADWTEREMTPVPTKYDNREANAIIQTDGSDTIELYFTSNRADGWHLYSKVVTTANQGADTQLDSGRFTHRAPAVLKISDKLKKLYYRGNDSQTYASKLYPAAETIDARYSGSTTVDTRNGEKISLRGNIDDVQRYTYDTGKTNDNWYARDTIGIYLVPDTIDQALIIRRRNQIERTLRSFLPIQVRTVFIIDQAFVEFVYDYDAGGVIAPKLIDEDLIDTVSGEVLWGPLSDPARGPLDPTSDSADFRWLRTFDAQHKDALLPDLTINPPKLSFRLFHRDIAEPGE